MGTELVWTLRPLYDGRDRTRRGGGWAVPELAAVFTSHQPKTTPEARLWMKNGEKTTRETQFNRAIAFEKMPKVQEGSLS